MGVAVLMVSRIRYQHVLNQYLKGKKPFSDLIKILLVLGLLFWNLPTALWGQSTTSPMVPRATQKRCLKYSVMNEFCGWRTSA